jgi:hypothetical protein
MLGLVKDVDIVGGPQAHDPPIDADTTTEEERKWR